MRDTFLASFLEGDSNYQETIGYLKRNHPLCQEKGLSDEWKEEFITTRINDVLRKMIFEKQDRVIDIHNMLVASRMMAGCILLSITVR
jgi:hypothetical protein